MRLPVGKWLQNGRTFSDDEFGGKEERKKCDVAVFWPKADDERGVEILNIDNRLVNTTCEKAVL